MWTGCARGVALGLVLMLAGVLSVERATGAESGAPSCARGPIAVDGTIVGTPCDDTIVAPPGVEAVDGGGGDDTIVPAPISASAPCPAGCYLGIGSQTFEGGPGDDVVYGQRGNDRLFGGEGNDQLFGGIGDDLLKGGPGDDRLAGGFGADSIDGEAGNDYVRGDATIDDIVDRGGGTDTLSYSTGIAPGFFDNHPFDPVASDGLPPSGGERGVYVDLSSTVGDNGVAPFGGGVDEIEGADFEIVVGTAFSDYIVGTAGDETIYGGGGGDVIFGEGGNDTLHGGADGDHLDGGPGANSLDGDAGSDHCADATASEVECDSGANDGGVILRNPGKVSAGLLAPEDSSRAQLYLTGSNVDDEVTVTYVAASPASVTFALGPGSSFDTSGTTAAGCSPPSGAQLTCSLGTRALDSVLVAGLGGDDTLQASGFPASISVVLIGGEGDDSLAGGEQSEDILVDGTDSSGPGDDTLSALGGDDALLNNDGEDELLGGGGNDLFLSNSICDGDQLDGGGERDNASWAKFTASGVWVRLDTGQAGGPGSGGTPQCGAGTLDTLHSIEDLEGTTSADAFYGDGEDNQLLGWAGADVYSSGAGVDRILANSGDSDPVIACGADADTVLIDRPPYVDAPGADCESVHKADVNNFRTETQLEVPPVAEPPTIPPTKGTTDQAGPRNHRPPVTCLAATPSHARAGALRCAVRPQRLHISPRGVVERLLWRHWGGRRAIGFGSLVVRGSCCGTRIEARARITVRRLQQCGSRRWYTRITVDYGPRYRSSYVRRVPRSTPCL